MPSHALIEAIKHGDAGAVKDLITRDPSALDSNEDPASPVLTAMYHGHAKIADYIASRQKLGVFEAAAAGDAERLDELLAADPDITRQTTDGWTPLHLAAFFGKTEAARRLIDAGADLKAISRLAYRTSISRFGCARRAPCLRPGGGFRPTCRSTRWEVRA